MARVASKDGSQIAFEKTGNGPALVVVTGSLSHRNLADDKLGVLTGELKDHFTVYTYDRRGRGESGDTKPYAVDREIEDIWALIDKAGGKAYLYGASAGAALSLQAAARLGPSRVQKLALYEPPYGQEQAAFNKQKEGVNQRVTTGRPGDATTFFLSSIGTPPEALEGMKKSPDWQAIKKMEFTLVYDFEVLGNGAVPDSVKGIAVPTLVMDGEKSFGFMRPTADRIANLIPNAQRKTLKGQTHQAEPEVVAPALIEFFGRRR